MSPHTIQKPVFERRDERGLFQEVVNQGRWEALIVGRMNAGAVLGNHYHKKTVVHLFILEGAVRIRTVHVETNERDAFVLHSNEGVTLPVLQAHVIEFLEDSQIVILKSHAYQPEEPDTYHLTILEG